MRKPGPIDSTAPRAQAVTAWLRGAVESLGPDNHVEKLVDLGDRVLARWCWNTRGQRSGIGGELRYSEIVTYRDGRAILIEHFRDHEEALKAVGLEEEAPTARQTCGRPLRGPRRS